VRWLILACLFGLSFFGYIERTQISIVGESMMQELHLSQRLFGWLVTAFLAAYTVFQVPTAILGEYLGARRALTLAVGGAILAICVTALTPRLASTSAVVVILLSAQVVLGATQAALFPVMSGAIERWLPTGRWGSAQGLLIAGSWMGSAVTPPLVSTLLLLVGWRASMVVICVPVLLLLTYWQRYARDSPAEHPDVSPEELAELDANRAPSAAARINLARVIRLLTNPQIQMITISYFLTNYVFYLVMFWSFIYLRQERHLTVLESGWLASLPFLAAAFSSAVGGRISDYLCLRIGLPWGMRVLPLVALPAAALFLWLTSIAQGAYLSVAALCVAFGWCELLEGPFWSGTMRIAPTDTMTATAILNTGGNLGGVVATPAIAALSAGHRWGAVFAIGAMVSLGAALLWLRISVRPAEIENREVTV
jgi:ACS family glucarate transporter-like MFS transporter